MSEQKLTGYPSIDKPWLKYYDCDFDEKDIPEMSMYQLAERENANNLDSIALDIRGSANHFEKGITITYRELFSRIKMSAKASKHLGIQANEIVPIILPNVPEARVLIYSNSMIGATSYPITPMLPANQLESIVNENEIKNIFMFEAFYAKYADALSHTKIEHIIMMDGSESLPKSVRILKKIQNRFGQFHQETSKQDDRIVMWDDYVAGSKCIKKEIIPYYCENHIAAIIGTSGTTGIPKGVCLTDRNINAAGWSDKVGKAFEGSFMDALLPSIGYGISMIHFQTITGKYVYLIPELLTTKFPEALEKLQPDNFPGGPVHYLNLRNSELYRSGKIPIMVPKK